MDILDLHTLWTPFTVGDTTPIWTGQPDAATVASQQYSATLTSQQMSATVSSSGVSATIEVRSGV